LTSSSAVGTLDVNGFRPFASTEDLLEGDKNRQAVFADSSLKSSVWIETPSSDSIQSNWRIFSSPGTGQKTILVAQAKEVWDIDELPLTSGEPVPVIDDDVVYWAST